MVTQNELATWLKEGIGAAKAGHFDKARFRLLDVVEQDQTNEAAWYWLYHVFQRNDDKQVCLENLLVINPYNDWARAELARYLPSEAVAALDSRSLRPAATDWLEYASRSLLLRLVIAFWAGISLILLGGGIIGSVEWLVKGVRQGVFTSYITTTQLFDIFFAVVLIILGIVGLNVAFGLYLRSAIGFYGSLLLALGLLLFGPILSLIATPPNYVSLICTGGISGVIVLLTLASEMR